MTENILAIYCPWRLSRFIRFHGGNILEIYCPWKPLTFNIFYGGKYPCHLLSLKVVVICWIPYRKTLLSLIVLEGRRDLLDFIAQNIFAILLLLRTVVICAFHNGNIFTIYCSWKSLWFVRFHSRKHPCHFIALRLFRFNIFHGGKYLYHLLHFQDRWDLIDFIAENIFAIFINFVNRRDLWILWQKTYDLLPLKTVEI